MTAFVALTEFVLSAPHPMAGRLAYQCSECKGIFFPAEAPTRCPYCEPDDKGDDAA